MGKIAVPRVSLIFILLIMLLLMGWRAGSWIFRATDNEDFNEVLNKAKSGEVYNLEDMAGVNAELVCWLRPDYGYHFLSHPEDYVSNMLGVKVAVFPDDLGTSEGGYEHLFIRYPAGTYKVVKLVSGWLGTQQDRNWCAPPKMVKVSKTQKGWRLITNEPIYYDIP